MRYVKYISVGVNFLTFGKIYPILKETENRYIVKDDDNNTASLFKERFIDVTRIVKLKKLL